MANDWIKMRNNLSADPAVIGIAALTRLDVFAVVGRLHALWVWADEQSEDGFLPYVTAAVIDDKVKRRGFAAAMAEKNIEWLVIDARGVQFPKFGRHNGEPAKKRAMAAERQRDKRARETIEPRHAQVTDKSQEMCDENVTREEKRREEKKRGNTTEGADARSPALKLPFSSAEFKAAWVLFEQHRKEIHKPLKPTSAAFQLKQLELVGEVRAIRAIEHTIARGWQGIREPDSGDFKVGSVSSGKKSSAGGADAVWVSQPRPGQTTVVFGEEKPVSADSSEQPEGQA